MAEIQRHGPRGAVECRGPHFLEQHHRDVAAAIRRRAEQRVSELLDFQTHAGSLEGRGQHRQTVGQPLAFPLPALEIQLEFELVGIAIIARDAGPPVDAEFGNGAVPGHADDVAGRDGMRILIGGAAHVLPARRVLLVGRFGVPFDLLQDPSAGVFLDRGLMLLERQQLVARGDEYVQFRNPQGPLAEQLIDADRKAARPLIVHLHGQQLRTDLEGRIAAQAVRRVRVAVLEQVAPDGMLGPGLGLGRFLVAQGELDAIHVARPGGGAPGVVGKSVGRFQAPGGRVLNLHPARGGHQLDDTTVRPGASDVPKTVAAERTRNGTGSGAWMPVPVPFSEIQRVRAGGLLGEQRSGGSRRTREPQGGQGQSPS